MSKKPHYDPYDPRSKTGKHEQYEDYLQELAAWERSQPLDVAPLVAWLEQMRDEADKQGRIDKGSAYNDVILKLKEV